MKLAAAQIESTIGAIQGNLEKHYSLIGIAISKNVSFIAFPEMSLTGYCREEGEKLAFDLYDSRLDKLRQLSKLGNIVIVAGAPVRLENNLFIASFIIKPDGEIDIYKKKHLHDGEEKFYTPSLECPSPVAIGSERISLAICADINHSEHPLDAKSKGATLYSPSIFYSTQGIDQGLDKLAQYARTYKLSILMSNYCGSHWGINAGGKSSFWNSEGELLAQLDTTTESLLIVNKCQSKWQVSS